jgi:uncharacterized protein involved in oxidation of intracellular sulfur
VAKTLFILNEQPYGGERSYNGLRLAISLVKTQTEEVRMFLMGDAAACAKRGQKVPQGYYNVADMLGIVARRGGKVAVCGTCMEARGITDAELLEGTQHSSMAELTEWHQWADKVLVF